MKTKKKTLSKKAGRPKKEGSTNLREDFILAGTKLLEKEGLENFSLRKVANLAGVSHVALYHHFTNKEELLSAIAQKGYEKYFFSYEEELLNIKNDFYGKFSALGWNYIWFHIENPHIAKIMFQGSENSESNKKFNPITRKTYRQLREIIVLGQKEKKIKQGKIREKTIAA